MILSAKEARNVVWNGHEGWETITEDTIDHDRWSIHKEGVFKHIETGKFYGFNWSIGATENQDEQPFQDTVDYQPVEVEKKMVEVEKWVPMKMDKSEVIDDLITLLDETRHVYCGICKKSTTGDLHRLDLPDGSHVLICLKCKEKNDEMS